MTTKTKSLNKTIAFSFLPVIALLSLISITGCSSSGSFSKGDSIYVNHNYCEVLHRLVKPLEAQDIDTMNISDVEKDELKLKLNPLAKPYLIGTGTCLTSKANSISIGQYIDEEKLTYHNPFKDTFYEEKFIIIHPNEANIHEGEAHYKEPGLPKGYTWADHNFYMSAHHAFKTFQKNLSANK